MDEIYVAMINGQWIRIDKEDLPYHLHARRLKSPDPDNNGPKSSLHRFRARRERARNRQGSPLKHEYDPEANMYWRWVDVDGQMKWVKKDWSLEPPRKLWTFSDSEESDDSDDGDYLEMKPTAKSAGRHTEHSAGRTLAAEGASSTSKDAATQESSQKADVRQKRVSWGEDTFLEHKTFPDDGERKVEFEEDMFFDLEESDDRAQCQRFGGLATIESVKETLLRRKLLISASRKHDGQSCMDREESFDDQTKRKVSFGTTNVIIIPEEFVTMIDEEEAQESFATAIEGRDESEDEIEMFDKPEGKDLDSERNEQPMDGRELATTADEPEDPKPQRQTTIRFAPVTVVKESSANRLPTLKYFPDFCTASKPIFQPDRQRRAHHAATMANFSIFIETLKPFPRVDLNGLSERDSGYTARRRSLVQDEMRYSEECAEAWDDDDEQAEAWSIWCGSDGMERRSRRKRMLRSCEC